MKKKILLFIGKPIGISVLNFLSKKEKYDIETWSSNKKLVENKKIKYLKSKKEFIKFFISKKKQYDILIIVYWPWLVPAKLFTKFKNSINFHPAYLPYGRGWYPHVHTLIKKFKWGVTLHKIFPGMDDGDIWCQKEIKFNKFSTATELYKISSNEILKLFKSNFQKIITGKITSKKQNGKILIFTKKNLIKYDKLLLNKKYKLIDLIKINNARSFKKKTFNFFKYMGKKYSFKIDIKKL
tara:strand:+ start:333 stop:1049 length:717 start_codon:yes stop_codon:yes gene_type:complete